jgi:Lrp/AsnC family transcriptional regulator for asnA, asnC and gidA
MKSQIDNLDRKILDCLQEDPRMQCTEIARRLGTISARGVRNRVDRLINEPFIELSAGAIPERLGFTISADIYVDVEPGLIQKVVQKLIELDEVIYVAITTGDSDISTSVVAESMSDLQAFITENIHSIPGVTKTKTFVLTEVIKNSCNWPFPKKLPEA